MKAVAAAAGFAVGFGALFWILSEAAVSFELWYTGTKSRIELANDLGLGLLLLPVILVSLLGALLISWLVWRRLSNNQVQNGSTA